LSRGRRWRDAAASLVVAAQVAGQDAEFLAVFGDGAPGDGDALLEQAGDELLVAERRGGVLHVDQVGDHLLHAGVGDGGAAVGLVAWGEEVLEVEDAVRRLDVLVGDGAADGGLVDTDDLGDLGHRERLEGGDPVLEELPLGVDDLAGDALDGALALLDGVDEELAGADALPEVLPLILGE
jgi:hypothetical protein